MKYICYQESFVIYGWRVLGGFGQEMRRLTKKYSEIPISKIRFSLYITLMNKAGQKSFAILIILDGFQELHLDLA